MHLLKKHADIIFFYFVLGLTIFTQRTRVVNSVLIMRLKNAFHNL